MLHNCELNSIHPAGNICPLQQPGGLERWYCLGLIFFVFVFVFFPAKGKMNLENKPVLRSTQAGHFSQRLHAAKQLAQARGCLLKTHDITLMLCKSSVWRHRCT